MVVCAIAAGRRGYPEGEHLRTRLPTTSLRALAGTLRRQMLMFGLLLIMVRGVSQGSPLDPTAVVQLFSLLFQLLPHKLVLKSSEMARSPLGPSCTVDS